MKLPNLSGSDYFHLLLDRKMLRKGLVGNISRIHLELDPNSDLSELNSKLTANETLAEVADLQVKISWPSLPKWQKRKSSDQSLKVHSNLSRFDFENVILGRKVDNKNGLVFVDLCELEDRTKHAVISMHHVLFDHQGMMNFLRCLSDDSTSLPLFPEAESRSILSTFQTAVSMTIYMLERSSGKLGVLIGKDVKPVSTPRFKTLEFTPTESVQIAKYAWNAGARIGQSAFYQSVTALAVMNTIKNRGKNPSYLWFSVPVNQRRRGSSGHLVSNQLSFLFYKCFQNDLNNVKSAVASINAQLKTQIKDNVAGRYSVLQDALRSMPLSIYEWMVNLASDGKMSSFGFSDLGEFKNPVSQFQGVSVLKTYHFPPVPCPPGFNVAVIKEHGQLKFVLASFDESLSEPEMNKLESEFRRLLLFSDDQ